MANDECSICGAEEIELFDAISNNEIVRVCLRCAKRENFPLIGKPTQEQIKRADTPYSVYERMSRAAGLNPQEHRLKFRQDSRIETPSPSFIPPNKESIALVDNFHWHIQQARRFKKISHKQLADALAETEETIKLAEEGKLPYDNEKARKLISKFEQYLGIKLRKDARGEAKDFKDFKNTEPKSTREIIEVYEIKDEIKKSDTRESREIENKGIRERREFSFDKIKDMKIEDLKKVNNTSEENEEIDEEEFSEEYFGE